MNFEVLNSVFNAVSTASNAGQLLTTFLNGEFERNFENSDEVVKKFVQETLPCMINVTRVNVNETMRTVAQSIWTEW